MLTLLLQAAADAAILLLMSAVLECLSLHTRAMQCTQRQFILPAVVYALSYLIRKMLLQPCNAIMTLKQHHELSIPVHLPR